MVEVATLLVVLILSLLITRVATVALTLTGMTRASARFQARSALTGAGFTTTESESVVSHPIRRRIIMWLMLLGNSGLVIVAAMLILVVGGSGGGAPTLWKLAGLILGVAAIWVVAQSQWVDQWLSRGIERVLRRYSEIDVRDYAGLLRLRGEYQIVELAVAEDDWLAGRTLQDLKLPREGVLVLGVVRAGDRFIGAPRGETRIQPGDTLLLYGRGESLENLDQRRAGSSGNLQHVQAVAKQLEESRAEETDAEEPAYKTGPTDDRS